MNPTIKTLSHLLLKVAMVCALAMQAANAQAASPPANQTAITAIDILLAPDATMLRHAEANNTRLLKVYPQGFALDAAHRPHITMLQCFVRTADLDKVYAAEEKVLAAANVNAMKLEAFKFYYAPAGATGVAGISAKPTSEILKLQAEIIAAAKPFMVHTGPIGAFTAPHEDPAIDAGIIDYVSTFVPKMSGENFNPHVSTGVATRAYLDKMIAEPFEPFTFSPAGAAVYQLGPFGTAIWSLYLLSDGRRPLAAEVRGDEKTTLNKPHSKFIQENVWKRFGEPLDLSVPMLHPKNLPTFLAVCDYQIPGLLRHVAAVDARVFPDRRPTTWYGGRPQEPSTACKLQENASVTVPKQGGLYDVLIATNQSSGAACSGYQLGFTAVDRAGRTGASQ